MNTNNSIQLTAEKIKSFTMGLIGALFFALGFSYFSEKSSYKIPIVLLPVYEFLGNKGLAVGLLILGAILLYCAYTKFKNYGGKPMIMLIILPLFLILSFGVTMFIDHNPAAANDNRDKNKQEIGRVNRPRLNNQEAEQYLDKLEGLLAEMTKAKEKRDEKTFKILEKQFLDLLNDLAIIIPELSKTDKYRSFIEYNAYLSDKIHKMRTE